MSEKIISEYKFYETEFTLDKLTERQQDFLVELYNNKTYPKKNDEDVYHFVCGFISAFGMSPLFGDGLGNKYRLKFVKEE